MPTLLYCLAWYLYCYKCSYIVIDSEKYSSTRCSLNILNHPGFEHTLFIIQRSSLSTDLLPRGMFLDPYLNPSLVLYGYDILFRFITMFVVTWYRFLIKSLNFLSSLCYFESPIWSSLILTRISSPCLKMQSILFFFCSFLCL